VELVKAIVLGIVQGLTEFLPISSSGHLVIGSELLHFQGQGIVFDVFLHLGTLASVLIVFRREVLDMALSPFHYLMGRRDADVMKSLSWTIYVVIATIPAVIVGLTLKDSIETLFTNLPLVFAMLSFTGLLMIFSRFLKSSGNEMSSKSAFIIGCAQAMAIMPGISRSGSTIFTGMALGIDREVVARFSFIMSLPAILGAAVLQLGGLVQEPPSAEMFIHVGAGTLSSAVSGYFAIVLLLDIVRKNRLQWFGYYCLLLSFSGFIYLGVT